MKNLENAAITENSHKTLFGRLPVFYGVVSIIAACLALASSLLVVLVGVALWLVVLLPLVLIGIVSGLLGIGAGVYYKDLSGCVTGSLGLVFIGFEVWLSISNLTSW